MENTRTDRNGGGGLGERGLVGVDGACEVSDGLAHSTFVSVARSPAWASDGDSRGSEACESEHGTKRTACQHQARRATAGGTFGSDASGQACEVCGSTDFACACLAKPAEKAEAQDDPGLSTGHISPQQEPEPFELTCYLGGNLVKLKGIAATGARKNGKRGKCSGFSAASRKRLQRRMASINESATAEYRFFMTLTYPSVFPKVGATWKKHLDTFCKRIERAFDVQAVVWKLEPQKRGAPHFHLIVLSGSEIPRDWVAKAWYEVVRSGDLKHLQVGTQCDRIRDWRGVLSYASKYLAKIILEHLPTFWETAGRWWGIRGELPIEEVTQALPKVPAMKIRRVLRKRLEKQTGKKGKVWGLRGLSVYLPVEDGLRLLEWAMEGAGRGPLVEDCEPGYKPL